MAVPSFYCENCGKEVSSRLDSCPGCGQKFYLVRCPSCGFTDVSESFRNSCPNCGYTGISDNESADNRGSKKQFPPWLYKLLIGLLSLVLIGLVRIYLFL